MSLHDLRSRSYVDFYLAAVPEVGCNASHGVPDGVIEAEVVAVLVQPPLEEDDAEEAYDRSECEIHTVAIGELLCEDELAEHDGGGEQDGQHRAEQIPGCHLLEEQAYGQTQPSHCVIRGRSFEIGKEQEHTLDVQDGVDVVQTMPRARIHAQQSRSHLEWISIAYIRPRRTRC